MKQSEMFENLLDRVVQLSIDVEREKALRLTAERRLAESTPPQIDPRLVHDLIGALASDHFIDAIRAHRALTGYGLKESKDAIEAVRSNLKRAAA